MLPVLDRVTSSYPLSIGTALAFESIALGPNPPYDASREIPNQIDLTKYQEVWINIETLFRNLVGAIQQTAFILAKPAELKSVLEFEMEIIQTVFTDLTRKGFKQDAGCRAVFYHDRYDHLYRHKKHEAITFRGPGTTEKQMIYHAKLVETLALFFKEKSCPIHQFDSGLHPEKAVQALILTHVPYDLLSYKHFSKLELLESNTGKLKARNLWYTKYFAVPREEMNTLPFTRKLLMIFGDHVQVRPMDLRFRKLILDISKKYQWTPLTTEDRVKLCLELDIKEPYLLEMYKLL